MKSLKSSYACFRNVVTPRKVENLRWIAKIFQRRCNHNKRFSGLHKDRWMFDLCRSSWYESRPRFLLDFGLVGLADPLENRKKFGLRVLTFFHFFRHVFCFCFASWQSYWVLGFSPKKPLMENEFSDVSDRWWDKWKSWRLLETFCRENWQVSHEWTQHIHQPVESRSADPLASLS